MLSCLVYIYFSKLVAVITVKFSPNVARTASHGFTNLTYVSTYHFCAWWIFPIENPSNTPRSPFSLIQLNMTFPYFHFAYAFGTVIITTIKVGNNNNNHNCQQCVAKTIFTHHPQIYTRVNFSLSYTWYTPSTECIFYVILLFASSSIQ